MVSKRVRKFVTVAAATLVAVVPSSFTSPAPAALPLPAPASEAVSAVAQEPAAAVATRPCVTAKGTGRALLCGPGDVGRSKDPKTGDASQGSRNSTVTTAGEVGGPTFFAVSTWMGGWDFCNPNPGLYRGSPLAMCYSVRATRAFPNGLSWAVTTRLLDACGNELYNLSLAVSYRFEMNETQTFMWIPPTRVGSACPGTWTVESYIRASVDGSMQGGTVYGTAEVKSNLYPPTPIPESQSRGSGGSSSGSTINSSGTQSDPVSSLTGAFTHAETDAVVAARAMPLVATRSYNSNGPAGGVLGRGWRHSYEERLDINPATGDLSVHSGTGQVFGFTIDQYDNITANFGVLDKLFKQQDGTYLRTEKTQLRTLYDQTGRMLWKRDRHNQGPDFTYDTQGRLSAVASTGRTLVYSYDNTLDRLRRVTLPDGRYTEYGYDASGQLATVRSTDAQVQRITYDAGGRLAAIQRPDDSYLIRNEYDQQTGRVVAQTDPNGGRSTFTWDPATSTQTMTDPRGGVWTDTYGGSFLIARRTPGGGTSYFNYDNNGFLVGVTDPLDRTTTFKYTWPGNLIERTGPRTPTQSGDFGDRETYDYNQNNDLTLYKEFRSEVTNTVYDYDGGDLIGIRRGIDPATGTPAATESFTYNPDGTLATATDARQKTRTFSYNAAGDLTSVTGPNGTTTYTYDTVGRIRSTVPSRGNAGINNPDAFRTTFTYDDADRLLTTLDPLGRTTNTEYDTLGRVARQTNARGKTTTYAHDRAGHVTSIQGPDPTIPPQGFTFDPNGNVETFTDARGAVYRYTHDGDGRMTKVTGPAGTWLKEYDTAGQLKKFTAPTGRATSFTYESRGLPTQITYSDNTPAVSFTYDGNGSRATMTDSAGTVSYKYDSLNRVTSVTRGTDAFTYAWDGNGNLTSRTAPGQPADTFTYDDANRMTAMARDGTNQVTYAYDVAAGTRTATLRNGVVNTIRTDAAGRVTENVSTKGTVTIHRSLLTLDNNDNPTRIVDGTGASTSYAYDNLDRLTAVCYTTTTCDGATNAIRYTYDANGNRLTEQRSTGTTTWTYTPANQPMTRTGLAGAATYTKDADGNITSDGTTTNAWNAAGQMTSTTAAGKTTTFTYDGEGRRLSSTLGTTPTRYLWDPQTSQLALERDSRNATIRSYKYARTLIGMTAGGVDYTYTTDQLGSVRAVTDTTGAVLAKYEFEPYGRTKTQELGRKAPVNPLQFTGQYSEGTAGYHLRARQYNAVDGMFTSPDPAWTGSPGSGFRYANNPMVYTDPLGLFDIDSLIDDVNTASGWAATAAAGVTLLCPPCAPVSAPLAGVAGAVNAGTGLYQAYQSAQKGATSQAVIDGALAIAGGLIKLPIGKAMSKACSFSGTTVVLMADGTKKPIEDIKVGDKVIATDPETGKQKAKTVTHVWVHDDTLTDFAVEGEVITTTEDHPFWSVTDQQFERADQLAQGDKVVSADGTSKVVSRPLVESDRVDAAYNLTVEGIHTYHVGDAGILVHNTCGWNAGTPLPSGERAGVVGNRIWGRGTPSPTRLHGLSPDELRAIASREDAVQLRDWYAAAEAAETGGKTAPVRVGLADQIIAAWDLP